jgi:hypothetical protein
VKLVMVVLAVAFGLPSPSPSSHATDVQTVVVPGSPVPVVSLPGDNRRFSSYDFRQDQFGDVDWPVSFIFRGNATVSSIKKGLCKHTVHAWKYCASGSPMFMFDDPFATGTSDLRFTSDSGVKRFNEQCSTTSFTAHMRLYALTPPDNRLFATRPSAGTAAKVVGTVHLDFDDKAGCSGRIHGYPDVAEQWFIEAMKTVPGWTLTPGAWNLHTASDPYVVLRKIGGAEVPHVYGLDGLATDVLVS